MKTDYKNMSDEQIMVEIGLLPYDEARTPIVRDKYLLTEDEQDKAIEIQLKQLSQNGKYPLSKTTERYASYDALCFAQFCKTIRNFNRQEGV